MLTIDIKDIPIMGEINGIEYKHLVETEYSTMYNRVILFNWDTGHMYMRLYDWYKLKESDKKEFLSSFGILGLNLYNVATKKKIIPARYSTIEVGDHI